MQWFLDLCAQPGGHWAAILALTLFACLTLVSMVALVQWRKLRQTEEHAALTHNMLERGMSADEILRVLGTGNGRRGKKG